MKMNNYLFSFLIIGGLMSCQKEEFFVPEDLQNPLSRNGVQHNVGQESFVSLSRSELLKRYAPIFHMGVNTGADYYECQDLIVGVDHDFNWGTYDDDKDIWASSSHWARTTLAANLATYNATQHDITPIVYGSMIELEDTYILSYEVYHTYNEIAGGIGDHLNDVEGVNIAVCKQSGAVKGATSTVHSVVCWATPWSTDEGPNLFDNYNNETYKLRLTGTHPHFWIGANGAADLIFQTHGHAIFPFYQKMNTRGVTYMVAENDIPVLPGNIGEKQANNSYSSSASYILVPEEELLIKNQMGSAEGNMYQVGQSKGQWGGQFWGNGYYGFVNEGDGSTPKQLRYRYNQSYAVDLDVTYLYNPPKGFGTQNSNWVHQVTNGLTLPASTVSFYKGIYANIPGSGFFDKRSSNINDKLNYYRFKDAKEEFIIEAMVRRVGKLHLNQNWFSNPENKQYVNNLGPTGGVMLSSGLSHNESFVYVAWAPEINKIAILQRSLSSSQKSLNIDYLDVPSTYRHFKVEKIKNDSIYIYAKDYRDRESEWLQVYSILAQEAGLNNSVFGGLVTQSDLDSNNPYYWTNAEYDAIQIRDVLPLPSKAIYE